MKRLLTYALRHRIPTLGIALCYAVFCILYHEDGQDIVRLIQRNSSWMWGAMAVSVFGGVVWGREIWPVVRRSGMEAWLWGGIAVASVAGYILLMSYPTEVVHYLQYGILSGLLAVVFRRVSPALVLTTIVGIADEAYQYWWLHRHWGVYFDFNDVLLNIIAGAIGLGTVASVWPWVFVENDPLAATQRSQPQIKERNFPSFLSAAFAAAPRLRSGQAPRDTSFLFGFILLVLFAVCVWTDLIAIQRADLRDHTWLLLNRMPPFETFWETFNGQTQMHHVVRAWWGVVLCGAMTVGGTYVVEQLRRREKPN